MQEKTVLKVRVNWGALYGVAILSYVLTIALSSMVLSAATHGALYPSMVLVAMPAIVSLIALDIMFFPALRSLSDPMYHDLIVMESGLSVKGRYFPWKDIKSISFNTNRVGEAEPGRRLIPVFNEIYVLDQRGREYSVRIGITMGNRSQNINLIIDALAHVKRASLLSDWAQKR